MRLSTLLLAIASCLVAPTPCSGGRVGGPIAHELHLQQQQLKVVGGSPDAGLANGAHAHGSPRIPRPTADDAFDRPQSRDARVKVAVASRAEVQGPGHDRIRTGGPVEGQLFVPDAPREKAGGLLESDPTAQRTTETAREAGIDGSGGAEHVIVITASQPTAAPAPAANTSYPSPADDPVLGVSVASEEKRKVLWAGVAMGVVGIIMCSF